MNKLVFATLVALLLFSRTAGAQCPVSITPASSMTTCAGFSALQATIGNGYTYQWQTSPNATSYTNIAGATGNNYFPQTSGYYRVVVIGTANCTATSNVTYVNVQPSPPATITPGGPVCPGTSLCANTGSGLTYQWLLNGVTISGASSGCFTAMTFGSYSVRVTNGFGCTAISAPVTVSATPPVINSIAIAAPACPGGTVQFNTSVTGGASYQWTGPNSFTSALQNPVLSNASLSMAGVYSLTATNNCGSASSQYTLAITCSDSVYPGDVNYDYVVDANDALALALAYGYTGPARPGASVVWIGQWCSDWNGLLPATPPTVNRKHGDCNGDGLIDNSDLVAISINYSMTHAKNAFAPQPKVTGLPDLYFDLSGIYPYPGAMLTIPVVLGSPSSPMTKLTGLKARIELDGMQLTSALSVQPGASTWLGAPAELLSFENATANNQVDWVLSRNDRRTASGSGPIGYLHLTVPATALPGQPFELRFRDVRMVDSTGGELSGYNVLSDSAVVQGSAVAGLNLLAGAASIVPNPSSGAAVLRLQLQQGGRVRLSIRDMSGRQVAVVEESLRAGAGSMALPSEGLAPGSYSVGVFVDGVMAENVRWVKLR